MASTRQTPRPQPPRTVLTVTLDGVAVPAHAARLAAPLLRAEVTEFRTGGPRGHSRRRVVEEYFVKNPDGTLVAPGGLTGRVADGLRRLGFVVVIEDRRCYGPRQSPDPCVLARCRPSLAPFLEAAVATPRGIDRPRSRDELAERVAGLLDLFPAARALVLAANAAGADDLYRRVVGRVGRRVYTHSEWFWSAAAPLVVAPVRKLRVAHQDGWDLLIADDAVAAVAPSLRRSFGRIGGLRVYGFVPGGANVSPRQQLLLEAGFGPDLLPTPSPGVAVHWAIPPWSLPPDPEAGPLDRKRWLVWANGPRNRFIAAVAAAVRAADGGALAGAGLGRLAEDLAALDAPPRVAVRVESPEHGRALVGRLPGWRLVTREPRPPARGWGGWDPAAPLRDPDGFDRCVLTTLAARNADRLDVDVLVRADGAGSPLRLPGCPAADRGPGRPQVVVDFADDADDAAVTATRDRARWCQEAGWAVAAAPPWVTER